MSSCDFHNLSRPRAERTFNVALQSGLIVLVGPVVTEGDGPCQIATALIPRASLRSWCEKRNLADLVAALDAPLPHGSIRYASKCHCGDVRIEVINVLERMN